MRGRGSKQNFEAGFTSPADVAPRAGARDPDRGVDLVQQADDPPTERMESGPTRNDHLYRYGIPLRDGLARLAGRALLGATRAANT